MQSKEALGTDIELRLSFGDKAQAELLFERLWRYVDDFENRFSRFLTSSELTKFNLNAGERVEVSSQFFDILKACQQMNLLTDGFFNPFVGPAVQKKGYGKSISKSTKSQPLIDYKDRDVCNFSSLKLFNNSAQIPTNSALDFGGIGKGYLADKLATIAELETPDYCFSIGGDIIASGTPAESKTWEIHIQSADDPTKDSAVITGKGKYGVATSGKSRSRGGIKKMHQIDPITSQLVISDFDLSSVVAETAMVADVIASSLLSGGLTLANSLVESQQIKSCLLQKNSGSSIVVGRGYFDEI